MNSQERRYHRRAKARRILIGRFDGWKSKGEFLFVKSQAIRKWPALRPVGKKKV